MDRDRELGTKGLEALELPEAIEKAVKDVQAELAESYREGFLAMVDAMGRQASALNRVQATLNLLVQRIAPDLEGRLPTLRAAGEDEEADLGGALVAADPLALGYTLSQAALAQLLDITQSDVSVLVRAFGLPADGAFAVTVRRGKGRGWNNYHPRAIARFKELVRNPPKGLTREQQRTLERVRHRWGWD